MSITRALFVACLVVALSSLSTAQAPTPTDVPVLPEVAKQQIKLHMLTMENLQLKFEAEKGALVRLLQTLNRDGYDLDLQTFAYTSKAKPVEAPSP